jgi:hypothetical protein
MNTPFPNGENKMENFLNNQTIKFATTPAQNDMLNFVKVHHHYFGYTGEVTTKTSRATISNPIEMREAILILGESNKCVARKLVGLIDIALAPSVRAYHDSKQQSRIQALVENVDIELTAKKVAASNIEASLPSSSDLSLDALVAFYK